MARPPGRAYGSIGGGFIGNPYGRIRLMFTSVPLLPKSLEDYRAIVGDDEIDTIRSLAEPLRSARILHLNATAFGGGVAELLSALVPLKQDLGIDADWQVMRGSDEFFAVTKTLHNALQGAFVDVDAAMHETFLQNSQLNADLWDEEFDFVIIHDPQPVAIRSLLRNTGRLAGGCWVWRCHIDLTAAQPDVWDFLRPYVETHDAAIFTIPQYVKNDLHMQHVAIIPPAIDPLSPKNYELPEETITTILGRYGIDCNRPIMTQVSRFDPWKDPLGVIDTYRIVKSQVPDLQLVMVASMAHDDPEGWSYFERTARHAGNDYDIFLLSNLNGVGNVEVNAIQRAANVIIQKSLREGFGLTVTEGLWKNKPVIAGNVGGIPTQILDGRTGYLVNSVTEAADRAIEVLTDFNLATSLGASGHEHVRTNFLTTTNLKRYLELMNSLSSQARISSRSAGSMRSTTSGPETG
jgi:trehalose synthase